MTHLKTISRDTILEFLEYLVYYKNGQIIRRYFGKIKSENIIS